MTRQITFSPSGKSCDVEANETVLEACLRAGLAPDYGCSNGNCGLCKAKLLSGDIIKVRHHDHGLSEAEKADGAFLMCAYQATGDIEIEADVTQGPEDIPVQVIDTKVKSLELLDPQVMQLHLQTPRSKRLRFISGQSVELETAEGIRTRIAIASCPCDDRNLFFHVPHIPGDAFSELIFEGGLSNRSTVRLNGPIKDTFYLEQTERRPSLILSWHTGFAPVIGIVEHAMSLEIDQDIHLFRFSPSPSHQYLANLGRSWADAYDNISAHLMTDRITLLSGIEDCERILSGVVDGLPNISEFNAYVAGPPNFIQAARNVLARHGLGAKRVKTHTDWIGIFD